VAADNFSRTNKFLDITNQRPSFNAEVGTNFISDSSTESIQTLFTQETNAYIINICTPLPSFAYWAPYK
jgi:hypothetical protein